MGQTLFFYPQKSAVYLNAASISLTNSYFSNNNFGMDNQIYEGGFLDIYSNNFAAVNSVF